MIEISEYVEIADWQERGRARERIPVERTATSEGRQARRRKAELLAAEAALLLLGYFEEDGKAPQGDARPSYVLFDYNPDADPVTGGSTDVRRVQNAKGVVLWQRGGAEWEFDADVTDFLAGAVELDSAVFYTVGPSSHAYSLPI